VHVCSLFQRLGWAGQHAGGYPVLWPFSLLHDFGSGDSKPIFLAETAHRALLFASRDFAGGETARALYFALEDLQRLATDDAVELEYLQRLARDRGDAASGSALGLLRSGWLDQELAGLAELRERVGRARQAYQYGLVAAIRFAPPSVDGLCRAGQMGVRVSRPIRPEELVAVATIGPSYKHNELLRLDSPEDWPSWSGVLHALSGC
jgi:hypothetical protein